MLALVPATGIDDRVARQGSTVYRRQIHRPTGGNITVERQLITVGHR